MKRPLAAALAASLSLAACGGDAPDDQAAAPADDFCSAVTASVERFLGPPPTGTDDNTIVGGGIADLQGGMNPFASSLEASGQHQLHVNLMSLVRQDGDLEPEPYLATRWELAEDGTRLTFVLRDDVFWHDGTPTTAHDVAFTFERARDPETGFANAAYFRFYEDVEVLDAHTVRFQLRPHAQTIDTWAVVPIVPAHLLEDVPSAELAAHPFGTRCPVGNGPFRFVEHREADRWVFAANPQFPADLGGPPEAARYVFRVIPDQTTLATELMAGNVHVFFDIAPDQARTLQGAPGVRVLRNPSRTFDFLAWNGRRPALADARVRRALTKAVDRNAIVDNLLNGFGTVANSSVPPFHWGYAETAGERVGHDPREAERLLDEAGVQDRDGDGVREGPDGEPLVLQLLYNEANGLRGAAGQVVQASLAEVGVTVNLNVMEMGALVGRVNPDQRDFDGLLLGYTTDFRIDDADLYHSSRHNEMMAFSGTSEPTLDALLDSLPVVRDREVAQEMWARYQRTLVEVQPFTYLFFPDVLTGVSARLGNVEIDERGAWRTIADWKLAEASSAGGA